jgi:hypothetical protein
LPKHGSLPVDRYLAPICTGLTSLLTAALLFFAWEDQRAVEKRQ